MKLIVRKDHIEVSDHQMDYLERKMEHLTHLAKGAADESAQMHIDVVQSTEADSKVIFKATLQVPGSTLHAETAASAFEEGVDLLEGKFRRQLEKYKAHH
jgi:ribosomal subunit interface protein